MPGLQQQQVPAALEYTADGGALDGRAGEIQRVVMGEGAEVHGHSLT
ncbi:hypothetical protein [Kribbella ginsengisoli]